MAALIVTAECWAKTIADYNNKNNAILCIYFSCSYSPRNIPLLISPPLKNYDIYNKFAVKQHKSEGGGGMNELTTFLGLIFFHSICHSAMSMKQGTRIIGCVVFKTNLLQLQCLTANILLCNVTRRTTSL